MDEVYNSLLKWIEIFDPNVDSATLNDGVLFSKILHQISPEIFTDSWLSKIKTDVGENWRLKVSNLKKIVDGIWDFYDDLNINSNLLEKPDVNKISEQNDEVELKKLVQLILGCAVNCIEKQNYITQIMEMDEVLQKNIMRALQDIEYIWSGNSNNSRNSMSMSISSIDLKSVQEERDDLAQKCHEKDRQISILLEEKTSIQHELSKLQVLVERYENPPMIGDNLESIGPIHLGSARYNDLRKQVDHLKTELINSETVKEDFKMKCTQQEKEIMDLKNKVEDMNKALSEQSQLTDEIDVLREESEKSKIYETQLQTLKKKLEDYNDLKKQIKHLEDRSAEYLKQNNTLSEESKKYSGLKGQNELYKKELQELHAKLDSEMNKTVKIQFDFNILQTKIAGLERERDNLRSERDSLRETVDELRCSQGTSSEGDSANISKEILGESLKDKIDLLEAENKALREGEGGKTALSQLLDDANQRNEKLRDQLKSANQKILALSQTQSSSDQIKDETKMQLKQAVEKGTPLEEAQVHITKLNTKVKQLEVTLQAKEQEYACLDTKYKKCVEKAKEVIKAMDPRAAGEAALIDKSKSDSNDEEGPMTQKEAKLIATAFYNLSLNCQREAVDARLALMSGQGQSFLARQRQPPARKPLNMNVKK